MNNFGFMNKLLQNQSYREAFITAIKGILATTPGYKTKDIVVVFKDLTFPTYRQSQMYLQSMTFENIVAKGEMAHYEQFLLLPQFVQLFSLNRDIPQCFLTYPNDLKFVTGKNTLNIFSKIRRTSQEKRYIFRVRC